MQLRMVTGTTAMVALAAPVRMTCMKSLRKGLMVAALTLRGWTIAARAKTSVA